jgi:hypothetical protein
MIHGGYVVIVSHAERLVPAGYPADSCKPVAAPRGALAQVSCDKDSDAGGPLSAIYTLVKDKARSTLHSTTLCSGRQR